MIRPWRRHDDHAHDRAAFYTDGPGGTGTATTLPMTDDERARVVRHPIGFAPPDPDTPPTVGSSPPGEGSSDHAGDRLGTADGGPAGLLGGNRNGGVA